MKTKDLKFWHNVHHPQCVMSCHVSHVMCQISCVPCHMSHVMCHMTGARFNRLGIMCNFFFKGVGGGKDGGGKDGGGEGRKKCCQPLCRRQRKNNCGYYMYWSRDLVSPVCGIFLDQNSFVGPKQNFCYNYQKGKENKKCHCMGILGGRNLTRSLHNLRKRVF